MYHYTFSRGGCLQVGIGPYTEFGFDAKFKHGGKEADLYEKDGSTGLAALQESDMNSCPVSKLTQVIRPA